MYYTPTILEIAGFVDKRQALFLAIMPASVNALGTLIGIWWHPSCFLTRMVTPV